MSAITTEIKCNIDFYHEDIYMQAIVIVDKECWHYVFEGIYPFMIRYNSLLAKDKLKDICLPEVIRFLVLNGLLEDGFSRFNYDYCKEIGEWIIAECDIIYQKN